MSWSDNRGSAPTSSDAREFIGRVDEAVRGGLKIAENCAAYRAIACALFMLLNLAVFFGGLGPGWLIGAVITTFAAGDWAARRERAHQRRASSERSGEAR